MQNAHFITELYLPSTLPLTTSPAHLLIHFCRKNGRKTWEKARVEASPRNGDFSEHSASCEDMG
jgi:hypothetical protein